MPFFDNFSKKVGDAAKTAAKKSGDLVEIAKLNMTISSEEDKINKMYAELGKAAYKEYENGENLNSNLLNWCLKIAEMKSNIESIKQKIMEVKNQKMCPNCGEEVGEDTQFCPKCGTKLDVEKQMEGLAEDSPKPEESSSKACPSCGAKCKAEALFCPSCGSKF